MVALGKLKRIGERWRGLFPEQFELNTPGCQECGCHMADHALVDDHILICPADIEAAAGRPD